MIITLCLFLWRLAARLVSAAVPTISAALCPAFPAPYGVVRPPFLDASKVTPRPWRDLTEPWVSFISHICPLKSSLNQVLIVYCFTNIHQDICPKQGPCPVYWHQFRSKPRRFLVFLVRPFVGASLLHALSFLLRLAPARELSSLGAPFFVAQLKPFSIIQHIQTTASSKCFIFHGVS